MHPQIYAVNQILKSYTADKLYMYIDIHATDSSAYNLINGNFVTYMPKLAKAMLFPRLLTINSLHFNIPDIDFNPMNFLQINSKLDQQKSIKTLQKSSNVDIKQGCGRIAIK